MKRDELVAYLDDLLQVEAIDDRSNNGLQVEGVDSVEHLAFAVDASLAAFEGAREAGAQMLVVHHGLFWGEPVMVTGIHRRRLNELLEAGVGLYAVHLPLDFHEEFGNNAVLARWLGLEQIGEFGEYWGHAAGRLGQLPAPLSLEALVTQIEQALGRPPIRVWRFGPENVQRIAIVSGAGGSLVDQAAEANVDVYLTGELSHNVYHQARELGLNVIYGGHYATETAGLRALADHLAGHFELETTFLDLPTGA
ncbi:MAG: Nif3-like dinuclear metal center hexameric protein [Anaerolineae bacterium]|jgi:dinuclear metal center YbgI/SA1388 family protein